MFKKILLASTIAGLFVFTGCTASNTKLDSKENSTHLMDTNGMTLYTFDKDSKNKSNCYNECESKWPVFYSDIINLKLPKNVYKEDFKTIKRNNGTLQTTYKSQPLYYFFKDTNSGETKGDGVKGVWHIVK